MRQKLRQLPVLGDRILPPFHRFQKIRVAFVKERIARPTLDHFIEFTFCSLHRPRLSLAASKPSFLSVEFLEAGRVVIFAAERRGGLPPQDPFPPQNPGARAHTHAPPAPTP